jgi:hypothetical protein
MALSYGFEYYFHLRESSTDVAFHDHHPDILQDITRTTRTELVLAQTECQHARRGSFVHRH